MNRWMAAAVLAVGLAFATVLMAAQGATLVLRSGERVSGELVDMGASGLTFRVNGSNRQYPLSQVAVIDFTGGGTGFPSSELDQVGDGGIVTTAGQMVKGRLVDVGGSTPLQITVDASGAGTREFRSNELKRIYIARPSSGTATATPLPGAVPTSGGNIVVAANRTWTDTGITVRQGDRVSFNASGEIRLSSNANDVATPAGATSGRRPNGGPMPQVLAGALLGRIGPTSIFAIGNQAVPLTMPADGRLFLGINDDDVADNSGEFRVDVVAPTGGLRRR